MPSWCPDLVRARCPKVRTLRLISGPTWVSPNRCIECELQSICQYHQGRRRLQRRRCRGYVRLLRHSVVKDEFISYISEQLSFSTGMIHRYYSLEAATVQMIIELGSSHQMSDFKYVVLYPIGKVGGFLFPHCRLSIHQNTRLFL